MKLRLLLFALLSAFFANAQPASYTYKGVVFKPVVHATMQIFYKGQSFLVDPSVEASEISKLEKPDFILYTDIHPDHLNIDNLKALQLKPTTIIIAPLAVQEKINAAIPDNKFHFSLFKNGESKKLDGLNITAIPMYNITPDRLKFHTKGRGNGYIFSLGKTRIYISGDTEDTPEMRALKGVDIAFVCMNLPYTMDVDHAASAVLAFKPKVVIPYHYRGQNGISDVNKFQQLVQEKDKNIEVELLKWY